MKKIVFFDADGTICDIKKGIPESAIAAVQQLTANGHLAFYAPDEAGLLSQKIWLIWGLPV